MLEEFLQSGNNFQNSIINALRRLEAELTRQCPVQGSGIRLQRTPSGTVIEAEPRVQTGCNMPAAAAPVQTGYVGPFAVDASDLEVAYIADGSHRQVPSGSLTILDSSIPAAASAGCVRAIGRLFYVPRGTVNVGSTQLFRTGDSAYIYLRIWWDNTINNCRFDYTMGYTAELVDNVDSEYIPLARLDRLGNITQIQYGDIRAGLYRAW